MFRKVAVVVCHPVGNSFGLIVSRGLMDGAICCKQLWQTNPPSSKAPIRNLYNVALFSPTTARNPTVLLAWRGHTNL